MMDEEIWKQIQGNEVVFSSKVSEDIQMSTVTYLGEEGVYFGIVVKDSAVYYGRTGGHLEIPGEIMSMNMENTLMTACTSVSAVPTEKTGKFILKPISMTGTAKLQSGLPGI